MKTVAAVRNALLGVAILAGAGISAGYPEGSPALAQVAPAHQDAAAVGETFVAARQALLAKDGSGVLELLSRESLARVERTRKAALDGLIRIGVGRDAAEVSFSSFFGKAKPDEMEVAISSPDRGTDGPLTTDAVSLSKR